MARHELTPEASSDYLSGVAIWLGAQNRCINTHSWSLAVGASARTFARAQVKRARQIRAPGADSDSKVAPKGKCK